MNDWFEAEHRIERAQEFSESRRWEDALRELDLALSINPHHASWHAQRGFLLEELDRLDEAAEAYEHAIELDPGDRDVALALGATMARLGRLGRALTLFEGLSAAHPDFEPAYCHRIQVYGDLGRHEQAEEMFYLAQELNDECPTCFFHMGSSLLARGLTEKAIYCWQRVMELDSDGFGVNRRIAQAYRTKGELVLARDYYLRELRDDPGNTDLLFEISELMIEAGHISGAAAKLGQILDLDPSDGRARFALGEIWLLRKRPKRALECFQAAQAVVTEPITIPGFNRKLGDALLQLGRFGEARKSLRRAIADEPPCVELFNLMGNSYFGEDKPAKAAHWYRRAVAIDDHNHIPHHRLGACLLRLGKLDAAAEHCLRALRNQPDFGPAMFNASVAYLRMGRWREARAMIKRAHRNEPANQDVMQLAKRVWRYRLRHAVRNLLAVLRRSSG